MIGSVSLTELKTTTKPKRWPKFARAMTPAERAVADRKRLRKLGRSVLPRVLAREAAAAARLKELVAIPAKKRTKDEKRELSDRMAMWIMVKSGAVGDAMSTYGPARTKPRALKRK